MEEKGNVESTIALKSSQSRVASRMPSQLALHSAKPRSPGRHKPVGMVTLSTALRFPISFPPIPGSFGIFTIEGKTTLWGSMRVTFPCKPLWAFWEFQQDSAGQTWLNTSSGLREGYTMALGLGAKAKHATQSF